MKQRIQILIFLLFTWSLYSEAKSQNNYQFKRISIYELNQNQRKIQDSSVFNEYKYYKNIIDSARKSKSITHKIKINNQVILINSENYPFCFSVGKSAFGIKTGKWKFFCEESLLNETEYRFIFFRKTIFSRPPPNYSW